MSLDLSGQRVLLVHEWLYTWAGSERVLEELAALLPHADIVAGMVTSEMRRTHAVAARARETWLGRLPGARTRHRWFLPLYPLAFSTFDAREYDLIVSISHSFGKLVRARDDATHVCYCLTPPRYLWDLRQAHEDMATPAQRWALRAVGGTLRAFDRAGAARVDQFVSISNHVAARVKRWYGRDSAVVYPPVSRKGSAVAHAPGAPYLLSLGRLVPYKRVDLAIRAAEKLRMKLIVAGDGPELANLRRIAGSCTEFVGQVSEDEAGRLMDGCTAFVFCAEEDFGIAPLEANAHGRPVVAYRRGAATETLVEDETATFFDRQDVDAVADAIARCVRTEWDRAAIERNAARFAPERFREAMAGVLASTMPTR